MKNEEDRRLREELAKKGEHGAFWYSWAWSLLRPFAIGLCVLLVVTGVVMAGYNSVKRAFFDAVEPGNSIPVEFSVASGSSLSGVANKLEEAGLIKNRTVFKYYADFLGYGQKIQSGEYRLARSMSMTEVLEKITAGDGNPLVRNITVIPGQTVNDIASQLVKTGALKDTAAFLSLCADRQKFAGYYYIDDALKADAVKARPYILEGYLAPDTYEVYTDADEEEIIRKLLSQSGAVLTEEYYERADEIGLSIDQVVILASIIEKEARNDDFARVSAVFHNRINTALALSLHGKINETQNRLQSDATIKYVTGNRHISLSAEEMALDMPYNTYLYASLPAGPVCNPSPAAIRAALYPDVGFLQEGYLYFCGTDPASGKLCFAVTLAEHERNVALYRPLWDAYDREMEQHD